MSGNIEIINAKIESTTLGSEDYGIFSCMLYLDYGGSGQGFGGYALDEWVGERNSSGKRIDTQGYGTEFIKSILDTVGVGNWEDLKGKIIRVKRNEVWGGQVIAIGNVLKDKWFEPEEWFKQHFPDKKTKQNE